MDSEEHVTEDPFVFDCGNGWKRLRIPLRRRIYRPSWAPPGEPFNLEKDMREWRQAVRERYGREPTPDEWSEEYNKQQALWKQEDGERAKSEYDFYYGGR